MSDELDPLLATKLQVPQVRGDTLPRPRLIERVEEASTRELLLVSAPAGFGKSTVLAAWARSTRRPVAWLSLDPGDNDSSSFWRYVVAGVGRVRPDVHEQTDPLLRVSDVAPGAVVTVLVNELAADREAVTLVLDDYHAIESAAIHRSLGFLLEHMPPGLRLVVASRSDPPLGLASMRARGTLIELRAQDLRFTREEALELFSRSGVTLSTTRATALAERTEGWVTGLQLAVLSLRGAPDPDGFVEGFTGSNRYVLDYLAEEVLERQPEDVRRFLLETSILDRLTAPLCETVTGRGGGQSMLDRLERANLFLVALDDERAWYRYHRLFADLLRSRLRERDPALAIELHRRAAGWYTERGLVEDAVRHALEGGDDGLAVAVVERHVDDVLGRGEGAMLRRWLEALPVELVRTRPGLSLIQAIAALNAGQLWSAESLLDDAERGLAQAPAAGPVEQGGPWPDGPLRSIPATIASVRASLAFARGQPEEARTLAERSYALQPGDHGSNLSARWNLALADWMLGRTAEAERAFDGMVSEGRVRSIQHLALSAGSFRARIQRAQGRLGAALRTCREGLEAASTQGRSPMPSLGMAHIGVAEALYERDELEEALAHAMDGIELCRWLTSTQPLATGLATLAWIRQAIGDDEGARDAMEDAYRTVPAPDVVSLHNPVPAERARLLLAQGAVPAVADWAAQRGLGDTDEPTYARELEYLVLARLLVARGEPDRATRLLARLRAAAEAAGRTGSVIQVLAVQATAAAAAGDRAGALARLSDALALGRPEGYVRVFADEGSTMAGLLRTVLESGRRADTEVPNEYVRRLLPAFRHAPAVAAGAPALVEPLTGRELEVLRMLASGRSNRRIADELVVTVDTVKKHVTHIFWKLGADNRTQAVALARDLGLIE